MHERLNQLLNQNQIDKNQYDLFLLFANHPGSEFLQNQLIRVAMEESPVPTHDGFAWLDGRRSVWRDIQNTVNYIFKLLEDHHGSNE